MMLDNTKKLLSILDAKVPEGTNFKALIRKSCAEVKWIKTILAVERGRYEDEIEKKYSDTAKPDH